MNRLTVSMTEKERFLSLIYLLLELFILPALLFFANSLLNDPLSDALINFVYFASNFICIVAICRRFLLQSLKLACKALLPVLKYALLGFALYQLSTYFVNRITLLIMPNFTNVNDQAIFSMSRDHFTLVATGLILLVPVVEEILYRGLMFGLVYEKSKVLGYLLSTAIFASIHVLSYLGSYSPGLLALCFLQYLPAGLCLAWVYVKADNIFAPILLHTAVNLIGVFAMR